MLVLGMLLAEAAKGSALFGVVIIIAVIWLIAIFSAPGRKGYDINHQGKTTIKPR